MRKTKSFDISKQLVMESYRLVKANRGAAGVDEQSLKDFESNRKDNLYKIWNRMSSGSYMPPPVKAVEIPKKQGGKRILGVPTVADRIAQMVVKLTFEPQVEPFFLSDSYGYRPGKSALDAVGVTRKRCWQYDWCLEFDICGLFDNIPHDLLLTAVRKHTDNKWVVLYIERWLKAPMVLPDGTHQERTRGTPQGGVVSPLVSNLFMHYAFDVWMRRDYPGNPWCRYADDGLVHCETLEQAESLRNALDLRFTECGVNLHPEKTKIVYCKDGKRTGTYENTKFDFLGYTFRGCFVKNHKNGNLFVGFTPGVSKSACKAMRAQVRRRGIRNRSDLSLSAIARWFNPILRGWLEYYGRYQVSSLNPVFWHFNYTLVAWAMQKYKRLRGRRTRASRFIETIAKRDPHLFIHWERGIVGIFA